MYVGVFLRAPVIPPEAFVSVRKALLVKLRDTVMPTRFSAPFHRLRSWLNPTFSPIAVKNAKKRWLSRSQKHSGELGGQRRQPARNVIKMDEPRTHSGVSTASADRAFLKNSRASVIARFRISDYAAT